MGKIITFYVDLGGVLELTEEFWFPDDATDLDIERESQTWASSKISSTWWHDGARPADTPIKKLGTEARLVFSEGVLGGK